MSAWYCCDGSRSMETMQFNRRHWFLASRSHFSKQQEYQAPKLVNNIRSLKFCALKINNTICVFLKDAADLKAQETIRVFSVPGTSYHSTILYIKRLFASAEKIVIFTLAVFWLWTAVVHTHTAAASYSWRSSSQVVLVYRTTWSS